MNKFAFRFLAILAALQTSSVAAIAACAPTCGVAVNGDVVAGCSNVSFSGLAFGNYDPTSNSAIDNSAPSANFQCAKEQTNSLSFSVDGGQNANHCSGFPGYPRAMKATVGVTTYYLCYQLYENSGPSNPWPISTTVQASSLTPALTPGGTTTNLALPMFGELPPHQFVGANGSTLYSDTVTVTVNY